MAEKKVDEDWKKQAREEKKRLAKETDGQALGPPPEPSFSMIVSSFVAQALIALGQIESPIDGPRTQDLEAAKFSIDMLQVIQDKTAGNLADDEQEMLEAALYDLRMRYVQASS